MRTFFISLFIFISLTIYSQQEQCLLGLFGNVPYGYQQSDYSFANGVPYAQADDLNGVNVKLKADLMWVDDLSIGLRPTIIYLHDTDLNNGSRSLALANANRFLERGFSVMAIDIRKGWGGPCSVREESFNDALYRATQDVNAAIAFLHANSANYRVDVSNIFLVGESLGGTVMMYAAGMNNLLASLLFSNQYSNLGPIHGIAVHTVKGVITNTSGVFHPQIFNATGQISYSFFHDKNNVVIPFNTATSDLGCSGAVNLSWYGSNAIYNSTIIQSMCKELNFQELPYDDEYFVSKSSCFMKSIFCDNCTDAVNIGELSLNCMDGLFGSGAQALQVDEHCIPNNYGNSQGSDTDICLMEDIVYGNAADFEGVDRDLLLDYYRITTDVTNSNYVAPIDRPVIVIVHGGGFLNGSKSSPEIVNLSNLFNSASYHVVSIDYRQGYDQTGDCNEVAMEQERASYRAVQDLNAALRYIAQNLTFIDTDHIYVGGLSAGGITALHSAYLSTAELDSYFYPGIAAELDGLYDSGNRIATQPLIAGCFARGAGLRDVNIINEDIGCILFHGIDDCTVPFTDTPPPSCPDPICENNSFGSQFIFDELLSDGNCVEGHFEPGGDHMPYTTTYLYKNVACFFKQSFLCSNPCSNMIYTNRPDPDCHVMGTNEYVQCQAEWDICQDYFYACLNFSKVSGGLALSTQKIKYDPRDYYETTKVNGHEELTNINSNTLKNISIYPNPNSGDFNIAWDNPNPGDLGIAIYDLLGRLVYNDSETIYIQDTYLKNCKTEVLVPGTYFLRLEQDGKTLIKPLIIQPD